jgi:AcrR family transcriptional regulator
MIKNGADRRVQKTRKLLQDALIDLIAEKGLEAVRIQDILDKANVGRSTFYAHFQDKQELWYSCFDEVHKLLEEHALKLSEGRRNSLDNSPDGDFTLNLFRFVERNRVLFKALLGKQGVPAFVEEFLFPYFYEPLNRRILHDKRTSIPPEIVSHYFVSAFIGTVKWWTNQEKPCPSEEIDAYFKQLTRPSFKSILGIE